MLREVVDEWIAERGSNGFTSWTDSMLRARAALAEAAPPSDQLAGYWERRARDAEARIPAAPPSGALDSAWAAAESALPEGWVIRGLAHGSPSDETEWVAAAGTMPFWETPSQVRGYGQTPTQALIALAGNLAGAFVLRDRDGHRRLIPEPTDDREAGR
jgi:hypothetical protein